MKDLSYHILDIVQNSIHAGASRIEITICEETEKGTLTLVIADNGCGMNDEMLQQVTDPFFTSSVTKKVGLGLPLLRQNAELTGGQCNIHSNEGKGTEVTAVFHNRHIDMIPMGDLAMTFRMLVASDPGRDFIYRHQKDESEFTVDTCEIRKELEGISLGTREVLDYLTDQIRKYMEALSV